MDKRTSRWSLALGAALCVCAAAAHAQSDAFPFGNPRIGQKLYAAKCAACHVSRFGGDGSRVFTRPDHRIHTTSGLFAQVQACNDRSHAGLSAADEESVAAWLNETYYKLKK